MRILLSIIGFTLTLSAQTANLWVDTNGGTCTRQGTPATYSDAAACDSFATATTNSQTSDTMRVKTGTYGAQSVGDNVKVLTVICEASTTVDSGTAHSSGLTFNGKVTMTGCDVAGDFPFIYFGGADNTWQSARLYEGREERRCSGPGDPEPILIYSDGTTVTNTTLRDIVIEAQRGSTNGEGGCSGDNYHLEQIRIDQNVDGVLLDRVTLEDCPNGAGYVGCGSGQIFITTPNTGTNDPTNITIRNTLFMGGVNYGIQVHSNVVLTGSTFAYNTFKNEPVDFGSNPTGFSMTGNIGPRPQNCTAGITFTKNIWQWATGTACGSDTRVTGTNFAIDQLLLNATTLAPESGSPVIDAAETGGYCTGDLGGIDRNGNSRPVNSVCDGGAFEFGAAASTPKIGSGIIGSGAIR